MFFPSQERPVLRNFNPTGEEDIAHIRDAVDLKRTMIIVVLALIPALLFGIYNVGYQHFNAVGGLADTTFFQLFFYGCLLYTSIPGSFFPPADEPWH